MKTSKKDQIKGGDNGVYDELFVKIPVTDKVYVIYAKDSTAAEVRVFNVIDYHQVELPVRIEHIKNPDNLLRVVRLSQVNCLRT